MSLKNNVTRSKFHLLKKKNSKQNLEFKSYFVENQILNWMAKSCFKSLIFWKEPTSAKNLREILENKAYTKAFRAFLQQELSEENLEFWFEVEKYRRIKPNMRHQFAVNIFQTYIQVGSLKEINIDLNTRQSTILKMIEPDSGTFDLAQHQVYILMERDSFVRFITSSNMSQEYNKNKRRKKQSNSNHENRRIMTRNTKSFPIQRGKSGGQYLLSN